MLNSQWRLYCSDFDRISFKIRDKNELLIHLADPQSLPVVIIVFAHVIRPSVCLSPFIQNLAEQNKFQAKTMFATGETVGLAEWIIDDTCLVTFLSDLIAPSVPQ